MIGKALLVVCLLVAPMMAGENQNPEPTRHSGARARVWSVLLRTGQAAVVVAASMDIASSVGKFERNPLMRAADGRFSPARGTIVKLGTMGGLLAAAELLGRRCPAARPYVALALWGSAGITARTAVRNLGIPRYTPMR